MNCTRSAILILNSVSAPRNYLENNCKVQSIRMAEVINLIISADTGAFLFVKKYKKVHILCDLVHVHFCMLDL